MNKSVDKSKAETKQPAEKPVSLHPLEFEEALSDLLRVNPKEASECDRGARPPGRSGKG